jgi:16S rRNA (uracil1498-N3)-methyltransferase
MIRLYDKDYHYIVRVRRLISGMCFNAILPGGKNTSVRILSTVDKILIGECLGLDPQEKPTPIGPSLPPIALLQGLPKGAKMDLIVRQAAEGGISVVVPFESEYSTAKQGKDSGEKIKRWERITKEARQQSGSAIETNILPPCGFDALLQYWESIKNKYPSPLGIMLHQEALDKGTLHGYLDTRPDFVAMAVGPEGGFSPDGKKREIKSGRSSGETMSMGTLRSMILSGRMSKLRSPKVLFVLLRLRKAPLFLFLKLYCPIPLA